MIPVARTLMVPMPRSGIDHRRGYPRGFNPVPDVSCITRFEADGIG